jgi:Acetyl-CoA dehydrogenase C-terminal like/Acyl-CoA dehydrogenase, C-terminal domain
VDDIATAPDPKEREGLESLLELLTPIAKSWPAEYCLEANKLAIQVLGGYGYTRDYPVERLYRDNRLNHIHEGAYGIQGLDLLGRKVRMQDGAALKLLASRMLASAGAARRDPALAAWGEALAATVADVGATKMQLLGAAAEGQVELALANATLYLEAIGHVTVAWRWLDQALVASRALESASPAERDFYRGKLAACRYFYRYELPKVGTLLEILRSLDDTTVSIGPGEF